MPVSTRSGIPQISPCSYWTIIFEAHRTILSPDGVLGSATDDSRDARQFHATHEAITGSTLTGATATENGTDHHRSMPEQYELHYTSRAGPNAAALDGVPAHPAGARAPEYHLARYRHATDGLDQVFGG